MWRMSAVEKMMDRLDETREALLLLLAELPDEALLQPGAIGSYSIADVLVNLTAWEAELITGLMRVDQGKRPSNLLDAMANRKAYNQKRHRENVGRDLDRVFDDLQQVRMQLETWLDTFSEKTLTNKRKFNWLNGRSLLDLIEELTVQNEKKYLPLIAAYVNQHQEQ